MAAKCIAGVRRGSAAARLLGLRIQNPPGAWRFVCCGCRVLSRTVFRIGMIIIFGFISLILTLRQVRL